MRLHEKIRNSMAETDLGASKNLLKFTGTWRIDWGFSFLSS